MDESDPGQLFESLLVRQTKLDPAAFDRLIAENPAHADALRRLRDEYERAQQGLRSASPAEHEPDFRGGLSFFGRQRRQAPKMPVGVSAGQELAGFRMLEVIGQGGMGQVWRAEQVSVKRQVALKLVRPEMVTPKTLDLFAREARAGARFHHPGIVDVIDHGTSEGVAWIAMEFVEGAWTLRDFLNEITKQDELPEHYYGDVARFGAQLADAMEAVHTEGVIHRDLKPQNILIAPDDTPKVTDFGLARITDESAISKTGDFAGTYYYMSPEQVAARRMGIDHRTDVFSLGIILYEMLSGRRPFEGDTTHQIAAQIVTKDPLNLRVLRSRIPRDLAVITGKCLEKDPDRRYGTMGELAADIRRHLNHEPIRAKPPRRIRKAWLWAQRNPTKSVASGVGAAALVAISGLSLNLARANASLVETNTDLVAETSRAIDAEGLAEARRQEAADKAAEVMRLSALQDFDDLMAEAGKLWPAHPENIEGIETWIGKAQKLVDELPRHRIKLIELRAMAIPQTDAELDARPVAPAVVEQEALETKRNTLAEGVKERRRWQFPKTTEGTSARWWHANLVQLIASLERLEDPETGLLSSDPAAVSAEHGWSMPRRLAFAKGLRDARGDAAGHARRWQEAIAAIRASDKYNDLEFVPQVGLVPIGPDPESGLWEFAHLMSGSVPVRGNDQLLQISADSAIVLVLAPGGSFLMGAQAADPDAANHDTRAEAEREGPPHDVALDPYLVAKYEVSQGQWARLFGNNPSAYTTTSRPELGINDLHPVEHVSWKDAARAAAFWGLELPTEARWEHACRGGVYLTPYPWGFDPESLSGPINICDLTVQKAGLKWPQIEDWLEDGFVAHGPVSSLQPNPFGLHHMIGNVWEWCADPYGPYTNTVMPGNGLRAGGDPERRVARGGGFVNALAHARVTARDVRDPGHRSDWHGTRLARSLSLVP